MTPDFSREIVIERGQGPLLVSRAPAMAAPRTWARIQVAPTSDLDSAECSHAVPVTRQQLLRSEWRRNTCPSLIGIDYGI